MTKNGITAVKKLVFSVKFRPKLLKSQILHIINLFCVKNFHFQLGVLNGKEHTVGSIRRSAVLYFPTGYAKHSPAVQRPAAQRLTKTCDGGGHQNGRW